MNMKNYTVEEKTDYIVLYNGNTVGVFPFLDESEEYISAQFNKNSDYNFEVVERKYRSYKYLPPLDQPWKLDLEKYPIVQGEVSDEVALENRNLINDAIQNAVTKGYNFLEVYDIDAFFDVQAGFGGSKIENYRRSIQLPSGFHFKMNENTHLRVQPNDKRDYALLCAFSATDVKVTGGHIYGDRYAHDYDGGDTGPQDLGYGIYFIGVENGVVDGVTGSKFTGDAFVISSPVVRKDDGSENHDSHYGKVIFSKNLVVKNCTFDDNRRNALALTDVIGAVLDNNTYTRTGLGGRKAGEPYSWKGHLPKHAIDLEAINPPHEDTGILRITERVENVVISNSTFKENYGDIDFYKCSNVEVFGNTFGAGSGGVGGFNVKMHNNTFVAESHSNKRAINIKPLIRDDGSHFVRGWEIYENEISGYDTAIQIGGENQHVKGNIIKDYKNGILLLTGKDVAVEDNDLESARDNARGFYNYPGGITAIDYRLVNNSVVQQGRYGYGFNFNKVSASNFMVEDSDFNNRVRIANSQNITIKNSTFPSSDFNKNNENIIQQ